MNRSPRTQRLARPTRSTHSNRFTRRITTSIKELRCFLQILSEILINRTFPKKTKNGQCHFVSSSTTGLEWAAQSCVLWRDLSTKLLPCRQGEKLSHDQDQVLLFLKSCSCHADKVKTTLIKCFFLLDNPRSSRKLS